MITPVSAATPASAMKPIAIATDQLYWSSQVSQRPPTRANGSESITISASPALPKLKYNNRKMIARVAGMTIASFLDASCMYSYCPLQTTVYPVGSLTCRATSRWARATYPPMSASDTSTYTHAVGTAPSVRTTIGPSTSRIVATSPNGTYPTGVVAAAPPGIPIVGVAADAPPRE